MTYVLHVEDDPRKAIAIAAIVRSIRPNLELHRVDNLIDFMVAFGERLPSYVILDWHFPIDHTSPTAGTPAQFEQWEVRPAGAMALARVSVDEVPTIVISGDIPPAGFKESYPDVRWALGDWKSALEGFFAAASSMTHAVQVACTCFATKGQEHTPLCHVKVSKAPPSTEAGLKLLAEAASKGSAK